MALTVEVKVVPSSGKNGWELDKHGKLKCFLKNPPEDGQANKELIKTLAKLLAVPQQDIEIIIGLTNRNKTIKIHGEWTWQKFLNAVGIEEEQVSLL